MLIPKSAHVFLALFLLWAAPASGRAITDDTGRIVELAAPATRIVTLYPGMSDIVEEIGAGPCLAGRTSADVEGFRAALPAIGTHLRPNAELVAALKPDLVLTLDTGRGGGEKALQPLRLLGLPVATFRIRSFADLFFAMRRIGILTGREKEADAAVANLGQRLEKVMAAGAAKKTRVFLEIRYPNLLAAGHDSMANAIIAAAGGENVVTQSGMACRVNEEALLFLDPDIYLVQQGAMNRNPPHPGDRPSYRRLRAVRGNRVMVVEEASFSRAGPRNVAAVEMLAKIFQDDGR